MINRIKAKSTQLNLPTGTELVNKISFVSDINTGLGVMLCMVYSLVTSLSEVPWSQGSRWDRWNLSGNIKSN